LISLVNDTSVAALAEYPATLTLARDTATSSASIAMLRDFVLSPPSVPAVVAEAVRERYSVTRICANYETIL
jgi:hypothetical protein